MVLAVEHGSSRSGRWLRRNRLRLALWIAVAEGVLILFDVIPGWTAFLVAVGLIAVYAFVGRRLGSDTLRQATWVAAVSQLLVALIPLLVGFVAVTAIAVVAVLGVIALALLFLDRR